MNTKQTKGDAQFITVLHPSAYRDLVRHNTSYLAKMKKKNRNV